MSKEANERLERDTQHVPLVVYYESIKRELKTKLIYECRCDERLTNEIEESIRLACTVLHDKTN